MEKIISRKETFTADTYEEAKAAAAKAFGVAEDDEYLEICVLEEPKKSMFGKVKRPAKIEATLYSVVETPKENPVASDPEPVEIPKEAPTRAPNVELEWETELEEEIAPKPTSNPAAVEKFFETETNVDTKPEEDGETDEECPGMELEEVCETISEANMPENIRSTCAYIHDIYAKMGVEIKVETVRVKSGIRMDISSDAKSGVIIGRRGETLDAVQYLASIHLNHLGEKPYHPYLRLMLDAYGYRMKRRETLEALAQKIARNVQRSGRATTLETMTPYERRIIHATISKIDGVTSHSIGEDPHRKVVVSLEEGVAPMNPRGNRPNNGRQQHRNSYNSHGGRGHGGSGKPRNHYGEKNGNYSGQHSVSPKKRNPEDFKRNDLDMMKTSFEREYKKPKPEDEIDTGLYGKIEF